MRKKKTLRSRFEDNYTTVTEPADNKKGYAIRYVYYAPWYIWQISKDEFRKKKQLLAVLEVLGLVLFLMAVLFRSPLNGAPLIILFTALAFCAQIMELSGIVDFLSVQNKTTMIRYEDIQRKLSFYPIIRAAMMALSALASVEMLASGQVAGNSIWMIPCLLTCAALAWQVRGIICGIPIRVEDNDAMPKIIASEQLENAGIDPIKNRRTQILPRGTGSRDRKN